MSRNNKRWWYLNLENDSFHLDVFFISDVFKSKQVMYVTNMLSLYVLSLEKPQNGEMLLFNYKDGIKPQGRNENEHANRYRCSYIIT